MTLKVDEDGYIRDYTDCEGFMGPDSLDGVFHPPIVRRDPNPFLQDGRDWLAIGVTSAEMERAAAWLRRLAPPGGDLDEPVWRASQDCDMIAAWIEEAEEEAEGRA